MLEARRDVQAVFRLAAEFIKHVLETLHSRLIALRLLRGKDGVERSPQFLYILHNLII